VAPFVDPDWAERGSLIGSVEEGGMERVIALGSWARLRDPGRAEIAFAVADDYQGRGVGTRLLEQLAELAAQNAALKAEVALTEAKAKLTIESTLLAVEREQLQARIAELEKKSDGETIRTAKRPKTAR